jgi:hypothetical protein
LKDAQGNVLSVHTKHYVSGSWEIQSLIERFFLDKSLPH